MLLLPSAVLSALVIKGRAVPDVSEWVRKRAPLIKIVSAFMIIAVCVYAWFAY